MNRYRGFLYRGNGHREPWFRGPPDFEGTLKQADQFLRAKAEQRKIQPLPTVDGGPELILFHFNGDHPVHTVRFGSKGGVIVRSLP